MGRLTLLFRISAGLVALTLSMVLLLDLVGLIPRREQQELADRVRIAEVLASQISVFASQPATRPLRAALVAVTERHPEVLSAGLRTRDGRLLVAAGDHRELWQPEAPEGSSPNHLRIPISRGGAPWATLELRFPDPAAGSLWVGLWNSPTTRLLASLGALCFFAFSFYMSRTLRHLDPSAVIPPRVQAALDVMAEGVLIIDRNEEIVLANAAFAERCGRAPTSLLGERATEFDWRLADSDERPLEFPWTGAIESGHAVMAVPLRLRVEDGETAVLVVNSSPVLDGWGRSKGAIVTLDDVTELQRKTEQLEEALAALEKSEQEIRLHNEELQVLAMTDFLTGVANRRSFFEQAEAAFAHARSTGEPLSFLMIDLDYFKRVNDENGHAAGDEVIRRVAQLASALVGSSRKVCRYGGEEFCVQLDGYSDAEAELLAESMRRKIAAPGFTRVPITASFGIAACGPTDTSAAALIKQADEALYLAKESGRDRTVVFRRAA